MDISQIEAIHSCMAHIGVDPVSGGLASNAAPAADPVTVDKFQRLMAEPVAVDRADVAEKVRMNVPFAERVAAAFQQEQIQYQDRLSHISTMLEGGEILTQKKLMELQYEIEALSFQQNIVSKVVESASSAIQTLIKNQ